MKKYIKYIVGIVLYTTFIISFAITTYFIVKNTFSDEGKFIVQEELDEKNVIWADKIIYDIKKLERIPMAYYERAEFLKEDYPSGGPICYMAYKNEKLIYNNTVYTVNEGYGKYKEYIFSIDKEIWHIFVAVKDTGYADIENKKDFIKDRYIYLSLAVASFVLLLVYSIIFKPFKGIIQRVFLAIAGVILYDIIIIKMVGTMPYEITYIEKNLIYVLIIFAAIDIARISKKMRKIADGDLTYKTKTKNVYPFAKEQNKNLEKISAGVKLAVDESVKSERFKTALITNVSHDLKTPLTSIVNYVDLLKKYGDDEEKSKEYLEILEKQSAKLKTLIEDLVEASKASTGNVKVNKMPLNINTLLSQAVAEYSDLFENRKLEVELNLDENIKETQSDNVLMWRIFDNILNNVYKYAKEDTRVYIETLHKEDTYQIVIKNVSGTKLNISEEELMERFVRGDESRNTEGTGLGLSIIKGFSEALSGTYNIVIDGDLFKTILEFKY